MDSDGVLHLSCDEIAGLRRRSQGTAATTQKCRAIEQAETQLRNPWCGAISLPQIEAQRKPGAWLVCRFSYAKSLTYFTRLSPPRSCLDRIATQYSGLDS
jgi:hypothetical protein